jgi:hypothetical protein
MASSNPIRSVSAKPGQVLHVETPNGIVNIRAGLHDRLGRAVDSVEIIPDAYAGERKVMRRGPGNVRLVRAKQVRS